MATKTMRWTSALLGLGTAALLSACFNNGQEAPTGGSSEGGEARPILDKGVVTPKAGEPVKLPTMTTNEGDFVYRNGKWEEEIGPAPLMKSAIERQASGYITDIKIVAGSNSGTTCPTGYFTLYGDLNRRAGGKWIYFCYKTGSASQAIDLNSIDLWGQSSNGYNPGEMKGIGTVSNGDMNQGAAGYFVYGTYSNENRGGRCKVAGIGIITDPIYPWPVIERPTGSWGIPDPYDLNDGAGGDFIYMTVKYESLDALTYCDRY